MKKNYTNFDAIDFAEDPSFIRWVQGEDSKATAFWNEWVQSNPQKKETLQEAKILVQSIQIVEQEPSKAQIQGLWNKIDAAIIEDGKETKVAKETATIRPIGRRRWIVYAAAACIGLIAFFFLYNPMSTISVGNGKHLVYTLPDQSVVELNAASSISFKKNTFNEDRVIHLDGEAFFNVEKGKSFKVITPNGTVEVLGTSFNVNARNQHFAVACSTGKVRVSAKGSAQILTKGLGTQLNQENTALEAVYNINPTKETGWRKGEFIFDNAPFSQIVEALERQYDVQITYDNQLKDRPNSFNFKNDDLQKSMNELTYLINATYKINGKQIVISNK
jgi:ferric-dicitrate binding protein FerR (iron transport regulator)